MPPTTGFRQLTAEGVLQEDAVFTPTTGLSQVTAVRPCRECIPELVFPAYFLKNGHRGESLRTATCLMLTVVNGKQGYAPCKIPLLQQSLFYVPVEFNGDHKTA